MKAALVCLCVLSAPQAACAGAWTLVPGQGQVISGFTATEANHSFGDASPVSFRRALFQAYGEYGWTRDLTLVGTFESAYVDMRQNGLTPSHAVDNAVEGGVRLGLASWLGWQDALSLEASLRTGGAFSFAVSANSSLGGNGGTLRLLYGHSFRWRGRDSFMDLEAGERFLTGDRPDETPVDLTFGVWLDRDNLAMAQSFNLFAPRGPVPAYPSLESHKLQFSWVRRLSRHWLMQGGGFFSPAGRNALDEAGLCLSLWTRF